MTDVNISNMVVKIPRDTYLDMYGRWDKWTKTHNNTEPNIIYTRSGGSGDYVTKAKFREMREDFDGQWTKTGKQPDYIMTNYQPVWDGVYREQSHTNYDQPDKYSCGSNTAANILSTWGIITNDKEMRRYCHTDEGGTDPEDLMAGVVQKLKDSGFPNSRCDPYNTSDLGGDINVFNQIGKFIADPNHAVAVLVNTGGKGWKQYYTGNYEHWVMPVEIDTNNRVVYINDPARTATLKFTYEEFLTGVRLVPKPSWYVFVGFR